MIRTRFQILLLAAIVLTVYYPSVFADFCIIDDVEIMNGLRHKNDWTIKSIFIPGKSGGLYYRPMIESSFVIDKYLLGLDPTLMHVENILIHLASVLLIFFIARHLTSESEREYLPLLIAIFFAIHPINSESVNWISARTDLLSGMFILVSALCLLYYRQYNATKYLLFALAALLFGVLAKEVALAFLPGILLIFLVKKDRYEQTSLVNSHDAPLQTCYFRYFIIFILSLAAASFYFLLRSFAITSNYGKIGLTFKIMMNDTGHTLFVFLRAFGFYIKKIFIPFPLSFAIMGADPLYELFAIPSVIVCLYIMSRRTLLSALFICGIFFITPSFVIAFNQIAWTQYAERYLYLPAAFMIPTAILYLHRNHDCQHAVLKKTLVTAVYLIMAISTISRNIVWQSNFALIKDTVEKSPKSKDAQLVYATLLAKKGKYNMALRHVDEADAVSQIGYNEKSDLIKAYVAYKRNQVDDALIIYEKILTLTEGRSIAALENIVSIYQEELVKSSVRSKKKYIKFVQYSLKLYDRKSDPFIMYNLAKISKTNGQIHDALKYYQAAYESFEEGNQYRTFARIEIDRLKNIL